MANTRTDYPDDQLKLDLRWWAALITCPPTKQTNFGRRARRAPERGGELVAYCNSQLDRQANYVREHLEDMPEIRNWARPYSP